MIALEIVEGGKGKTTLGEGRKGDGRGRRLIKTKDEKRTAFADLTAQPRPTNEGRNGAATHAQNANGALRATRGRAASWIIQVRGD